VTERPNRTIIVSADPERVLLLEEAFTEMDETRFARGLRGGWERTYVLDVNEAVTTLRNESFDVILFDHATVTEPAVPAFFALRRAAPDLPMVVLVGNDDEVIGLALVRQGAQDFLLESELDCVPLERALRCAVERQRLLSAQRNLALLDDVTGLIHHRAFPQLLHHDLRLAELYHLHPFLVDLELPPTTDPDAHAIRIADLLFSETAAPELAVRLAERRFAVFGLLPSEVACQLRLQRLTAVLAPFGEPQTLCGAQLLDALCDNSGLESRPGRLLQPR
jgi:DNA-binding NarL/FixJ family response regulator